MPRILPRLIEKIKSQASLEKWTPYPLLKARKKAKSLHKRVPPRPSFKHSSYPRSILLESGNPVVNAKDWVRHKTLPPTLSRLGSADASRVDVPRQMTEAEFGWWANPYLRMMASPLRKCVATSRHLPSDLLIRLVGVSAPSSVLRRNAGAPQSVLIPDGLLHPKYTARRRTGGGLYVLCCRRVIQKLARERFKNIASPGAVLHGRTEEHIAHLLRLRVVQEFELLAERLEHAMFTGKNFGGSSVILRRLARDEWDVLKTSGTFPCENAVAVLVVPPLNKDRITKQRPTASMSPFPPQDELSTKELQPTSTLIPVSLNSWNEELPTILPLLKVPLYNGASAFPSRPQRAALHGILQRILRAERSLRRVHVKNPSSNAPIPGKPKSSHAYVLFSDAQTAKRGDSASVARALWRLRMYGSEGWSITQSTTPTTNIL